MTSHTLGRDAGNTFKCGVAVAPLADWRYYDTIYAERYMGDPTVDNNVEGYRQGSIVEGKRFSSDYNLYNIKDLISTTLGFTFSFRFLP